MIYLPVIIASILGIFAFRIIGQSWLYSVASWVGVMAAIPALYSIAILVHLIKS
jgi:hypothetical protein